MKCTNPFLINNIIVPCMYCKSCRINKISTWTVRILAEMQRSPKNAFITLTYSQENLQFEDSIATLRKRHLQLYFKRLRKELSSHNLKIKYFACGEYGETQKRPHYHIIFIGADIADLKNIKAISERTHALENYSDSHNDIWGKGFGYYGTVTPASIRYVLGYVMDKEAPEQYEPAEPPFQLSSNLFGNEYIDANIEKLCETGFFKYKGKYVAIPKFIRDYYKISKNPEGYIDKSTQEAINWKYSMSLTQKYKNERDSTNNFHAYTKLREEEKRLHTEKYLNKKEELKEQRQRSYN